MVPSPGKTDARDEFISPLQDFSGWRTLRQCRNDYVFQDGKLRQQMMLLKNEANISLPEPCQFAFAKLIWILAAQFDLPGRRWLKSTEHVEQGAFPTATGTKHC